MINNITDNIRMWLVGKRFLNYMERHSEDTTSNFLNKYDLKEEAIKIFKSKAPDTLNEVQNTAVKRMYLFLRDAIDGKGLGADEVERVSSVTRDVLCNIGLIEECKILDLHSESKLKERILKIYTNNSWMNHECNLVFKNYYPSESCLSFKLEAVNGSGCLNCKAYLNENKRDVAIYVNDSLWLDTAYDTEPAPLVS